MTVYRLHNAVRNYAWGSYTAIAHLQGRGPSAEPEAELWVGAHPAAPSEAALRDGSVVPLNQRIATAPHAHLGAAVVRELGAELPFLLKVLAAERPLSLQVHPTPAQARDGFAAEDAAGVPLRERRFGDPRAKPELLVALTPFDALQGFRPAESAVALLERLSVPALRWLVDRLAAGVATGQAFLELIRRGAARELVSAVAAAAASAGEAAEDEGEARLLRRLPALAAAYPDDPGVAGILLLNHFRLQPGEGTFVAPGTIHAYLQGVGVEVMGNSDNVFRAGLTVKPVDVEALARTLNTQPSEPVVVPREAVRDGCATWTVPAREFALWELTVAGSAVRVPSPRPALVLCLDGKVSLDQGGNALPLESGDAAFVGAEAASVSLAGAGTVMWATHGLPAAVLGSPEGPS